jgi:hypothetical protein
VLALIRKEMKRRKRREEKKKRRRNPKSKKMAQVPSVLVCVSF